MARHSHGSDIEKKLRMSLQHSKQNDVVITAADADPYNQRLIHIKCNPCHTDKILDNCTALTRLVIGLQYYSSLQIESNKKHRDMFAKYMNDKYYEFLDDFAHLMKEHHHQLQKINNFLIKSNKYSFNACNLEGCDFTARHYSTRDFSKNVEEEKKENDPKSNFYAVTMDSLHYWLFHLFDQRVYVYHQVNSNYEAKGDDAYLYDVSLQIQKVIDSTKYMKNKFEHFQKQNKFNINVQQKDVDKDVFLDELYKYLFVEAPGTISGNNIKDLRFFIQLEEYDTDSFKMDLESMSTSNISNCIKNDKCSIWMYKFARNAQAASSSFNIGIPWYYWPYYQLFEELPDEDNPSGFDHCGYTVKDLFVKPKYSTFKEEIQNNRHIALKQYNEQVVAKANAYVQTKRVKEMKAVGGYSRLEGVLHCDILEGTPISVQHLISVIVYCDFTNLSNHFSSTFRKRKAFEPLTSIKRRNSEYYWLSKILKEVVLAFGQCANGDWDGESDKNDKDQYVNKLCGPFYCGMNIQINIPSFNIRLCGPTSTTMQIEVALIFAGGGSGDDQGIMIELNNATKSAAYTRAFNCSFISNYTEEDERLFFGSTNPIRVASIRTLQSRQFGNYKQFFEPLFYFECMVTAYTDINEMKISDEEMVCISDLVTYSVSFQKWKHNEEEKNESEPKKYDYPSYIYDVFDCFLQSKQTIVLDLELLNKVSSKLRDLIIYPMEKQKCENENVIFNPIEVSLINVFHENIFRLFPNVRTI
eukprot:369437_1